MTEPIDTLRFDGGLYAHIHHDSDAERPYAGDDTVRIVVLHRRYGDPANGECGTTPDAVAQWERENAAEWLTMPLWLYDHSGTVYRVGAANPFTDPWDSGRVGIIALKRSTWGADDDKLTASAQIIAEAYTDWANGDCYGYVLYDAKGGEIDRCWDFVGRQAVDDAAKQAADDLKPEEGPASQRALASIPDQESPTHD
jgi:hypothetical protein